MPITMAKRMYIETIFQRLHEILEQYDLTQPDEPAVEIKEEVVKLQREVSDLF